MNTDFFHKHGYQIFEDILPVELIDETRSILEEDAQVSLALAQSEIGCDDDKGVVATIDAITRGLVGSVDRLSKTTQEYGFH